MNIKEFFKRTLYYVSVPKCVCCKEKLEYGERGLCRVCKDTYEAHKMRNCPRCSHKLAECFCTYDSIEKHGIKNLVKLFRYSRNEESMPSNNLIYSLKQDNRRDVISLLADELSDALRGHLGEELSGYVITGIPRRKGAIVNFGYDHAKRLAEEVSKRLNIEYVPILSSKSTKAQKSVYGQERMENARFDYRSRRLPDIKGKSVILVDDIITTGASITNSADLIRKLRPKRIIGACLGTAYKEPYIDYYHSASL